MITRNVRLIDQARKVFATAQISEEGDHYGGTIHLGDAPAHVRTLFDEFEEIVEGQMFAFLDSYQEKIASMQIKVVFEDETEYYVRELQVFPSRCDVSFKLVEVPSYAAR
jgi:hypothetical protein